MFRPRFAAAVLASAIFAASGGLTACSDSPAEVKTQFCNQQAGAAGVYQRLTTTARAGDLGAARGIVAELQGRLAELHVLSTELTADDRAAVEPTLDPLRVAIDDLADAATADELQTALVAVSGTYGADLGSLRTAVGCD